MTLAAWGASVPDARAASVLKTQSGTVVNSANGTQTVTISSVDMTKSVLFFSTQHGSNRPVGATVRGALASSTTIEFDRVTDGAAPEPASITIRWYVVTFASGVKVQRGEAALSATTVNVAITAVAAVNQAFVLWSETPGAADVEWGSDDANLAELTSTTNLQIRADAANASLIVSWQVVEFTNAADIKVQKGSITTMTGATTSVTATLSPAVDVSKTFVLVGWRSSGVGTDIGARMLRAQLTNSTTVTIDRSASGSPDNITEIVWQAIELKDDSTVLRGSVNFPSGIDEVTADLLPPVNRKTAIAFGSGQSGAGQTMGRSPYVTDDITGVGSVTATLGIGFRAAASGSSGVGDLALSINKPTGTLEHDVMIASISFRPDTTVVTPPTGWTLVRRTNNGSGSPGALATYWKAADVGEPTSYTWTFNTSDGASAGILAFSGVDEESPIHVENGQTTVSGLTHAAPSVTTTAVDTMIVSVHGFTSSATWTPPAGMKEVVDIASETVPNCCGTSIEMNYLWMPATGASGSATATVSGDADIGYAHTLALSPSTVVSQVTFRRSSTAAAADVGWFVAQFDQGAGFKVGSFAKSTTTSGLPASQVITHSLGTTPKAIILWTDGQTNQTFTNAGYVFGFGMTDGTASRSVSTSSQSGVTTSNTSTRMANKVLTLVQWGETLVAEADLSSWNETTFTLSWTTNNATAYVIHYIVIGGPDVSAKVLDWTMGTATGNKAVTGVGFRPNAVIHAHGTQAFTSALPASIAGAGFGLGAMDADGDQWATSVTALDNLGTSDTQRGQQTDATIYTFDNGLTVQKEASWVSMDADGFTVNFTNAASAAAARVLSLALKGVNVKPGSFLKATGGAPASQTISGVGFQPSVVMLTSFQDLTAAAPQTQSRFGIGASDGTTDGSSAMTDQNNSGSTSVRAIDKTDKAFMVANTNNSTFGAEADVAALNSDGFGLSWTTNNNVQTQILYLALAPVSVTEVQLISLGATRYDPGVLVQWKTGYEIDNLGFHVYREIGGVRTRVTSSLIGGSALSLGHGTASTGQLSYAFWDLAPDAMDSSAVYWLEDMDLNGQSTWHGPASPVAGGPQMPPVVTSDPLGTGTCSDSGQGSTQSGPCPSGDAQQILSVSDSVPALDFVDPQPGSPVLAQWDLATASAVKISITRPGWYRIGQPELIAAGLSPAIDPHNLGLFLDGVEQAFSVVGEADSSLDPSDGIEFFATGLDTPSTDTRVYWLVAGSGPGRRLAVSSVPPGVPAGAVSFWRSLQYKERSTYFAALQNGDAENWFGQLVADGAPTVITMRLSNIDQGIVSSPAEIELALQGVTTTADGDGNHRVGVSLNGFDLGEVTFVNQERPVFHLELPQGLLQEGDNAISLSALGGEADSSLIDYININYWHTHQADADQLLFTAAGQDTVTIGGFSAPSIRVVDITDPSSVIDVVGTVAAAAGTYSITIAAPGTGERQLLAFTEITIAHPALVQANVPSSWHDTANGLDYVVLARSEYIAAVQPLVTLREQQGYHGAIVNIEDVYDEFAFGEKTPAAIRRFLGRATAAWQLAPRFVVLAGDATLDPRDYAGFGDFDLVPTKLLSMQSVAIETASDEWFADFDDDGLPELAVGRLPVRSLQQAAEMVQKIVGYETQSAGAWTQDVTLVADENDAANDFEAATRVLEPLLPAGYRPHEVFRGQIGSGTSAELAAQVTAGSLLVNYLGHGSTQVWGVHGDILTNDTVRSGWQNGSRLPFVVAMNCLNGFFQGVYTEESLAEALLRAPNGGAVAAWASSSLTPSATQGLVSRELFRLLFGNGTLTLGEAAVRAKRVVPQRDVRRSWIFFGDPATRLLGVPVGSEPLDPPAPGTEPPPSGPAEPGDFSGGQTGGDPHSDILWRNGSTGVTALWLMDGAQVIGGGGIATVDLSWQIVGTGDYNGDGLADILWRQNTGLVTIWLMDGTQIIGGDGVALVDLSWQIVGTGDYNGDGRADILWRQDTGAVTIWFMNNTQIIGGGGVLTVDPVWQIVGTGDYNADGRDDILWRHTAGAVTTWLMDGTHIIGGGQVATVDPSWQIVGTGDYNGDDRADILWRHSSGAVTLWLMNGILVIGGGQFATVDPSWQTVGSGDYNSDGRADILWRESSGAVTIWLMNGAQVIGWGQIGTIDPEWRIVQPARERPPT